VLTDSAHALQICYVEVILVRTEELAQKFSADVRTRAIVRQAGAAFIANLVGTYTTGHSAATALVCCEIC